jgi:hypothetical protein
VVEQTCLDITSTQWTFIASLLAGVSGSGSVVVVSLFTGIAVYAGGH